MATATRPSRSGSRAPQNPKTKAQRLARVAELTERIDARLADAQTLSDDRNRIIRDLREADGATFREIAEAAGKSEQAFHKAFTKDRKPAKARRK